MRPQKKSVYIFLIACFFQIFNSFGCQNSPVTPSFARPFYNDYYFPLKPAPKAGGFLGTVFGGIEDAVSSVEDTFKSLGEEALAGIKEAGNAIYTQALIPIKNVAVDFVHRAQECAWLAADSSEFAGTLAAKEVADATLEAVKQTAAGAIIAGGGVAHGATYAAGGVVEGGSQAAQGVLTAAEETTKGILTAVDEIVKQLMDTFNVKDIIYKGDLQSMAKGKLGNVECKATILSQNVDFSFDLDVHNALSSLESLVEKIVGKCTDAIESVVHL